MKPITADTVAQLTEAFAEFEDASRVLSGSYRSLERQVETLTRELASARLEQARELAEKERLSARLESLLDALPGGVVVIDQRGLVQEFNPVAVDLLGAMHSGEPWAAVVRRVFAPRWDDGHDVSLIDGRLVNIATQAMSGEPGQILLLKDVTETRRLQDQLAHHKRLSAKTEMAATMAHQIRTPLATALLHTGNITRACDDAMRQRACERAVQSLRKLERLVDEMLLFSRGGQLEVTPITIDALFAHLAQAAAEAFVMPRFTIEFCGECRAGSVYANLAALTSVSLNLIENSAQACAGTGHIEIARHCENGRLELRFCDSGPGIDAEHRTRIFEPFHTTRSNGTGLGLPVARAVARAHAGDLELIDSPAGACFVLYLPLIDADQTQRSVATRILEEST